MARISQPRLEPSLQKTERTYIRLSLGIFLGVCLFVALCWGGHRAYVRWQVHNFMRESHVALDKNDLRWATMAAQRAFAIDSSNLDACRTLADIAQRQGSPEAIEWQRRVVGIDPSLQNLLALAETALRFNRPGLAESTLAKVSPAQQKDAGYHSAAAHLALSKGDLPGAENHLRRAVQLAPNDSQKQLELADLLLRLSDPAKRQEGKNIAQRWKADPATQLTALHILLNDAIRRREDSVAVDLAKELSDIPDVGFADRLLALNILKMTNDPGFTDKLTQIQTDAAKSADQALQLINWLNSHNLALIAIDWSKRLPPEMLFGLPMRLAMADSYVRLRDWRALSAMLARGSWDQAEPIRLALLAKVSRETGDNDGFEKNWLAAVAKAEGNVERLNALQTLAFQWRWPEKATAILWQLTDNRDTQKEALQALYRYYAGQRDTAGLYRTLARLTKVMPDDSAVKNNFAQVALLLGSDLPRASSLASQLHQEQPKNAAFASTYAFALFRSGNLKGALEVMQALKPEQLNDPSIAAYYGVLLAANGQLVDAARVLALAEKANLLPEEEKLVADAKGVVARQ